MNYYKYDFLNIYKKFYDKAVLFTISYVHNKEVAKDIVEDVMIELWSKLQKKEEIKSVVGLLITMLKYRCLDYLRHQKIKREKHENVHSKLYDELCLRIATLEECNPQNLYTKEIHEIYNKSLKKLPVKTREIFLMSRNNNLTNKMLAKKLGVSTKTIEYHITLCFKQLRKDLKDYLPIAMLLFRWL